MTVTIRKLDKSDHDYFAYAKSLCGKATYFVYFKDYLGSDDTTQLYRNA